MVDVEAIVAQGKAAMDEGNSGKAFKLFNQAIEADPRCVDAYSYRGQVHLSAHHYRKAIDDFTSAIEACGAEDNEQEALAYWWRSCSYHRGGGLIRRPDVKGVINRRDAKGVLTESESQEFSRSDEQDAVRLFWAAQGFSFPQDSHEFEVPGEIVRTRDLLHEFLATSDWGEWSDDKSQKNTNNHRYFRRGSFILGSPARMGRWDYDHGISSYKYWPADPRTAHDTYKPARLQVTLRSEPNGTRVQMKYGDVLPQPSFPWWLCVVVAFAEASETMMDFLKRRYLKRESYFRLRILNSYTILARPWAVRNT